MLGRIHGAALLLGVHGAALLLGVHGAVAGQSVRLRVRRSFTFTEAGLLGGEEGLDGAVQVGEEAEGGGGGHLPGVLPVAVYDPDGLRREGAGGLLLGGVTLAEPVFVLRLRPEHPGLDGRYHRFGVGVGEAREVDGEAGLQVQAAQVELCQGDGLADELRPEVDLAELEV